MFWAAVPETTIHKYGEFYLDKTKIGIPENRMVTPPASDLMFLK
jgi:hypothetical protein